MLEHNPFKQDRDLSYSLFFALMPERFPQCRLVRLQEQRLGILAL